MYHRIFLVAVIAAAPLSAPAAEPKVAERWAVLIGVDDYANANDLQFCGADQTALRERLLAAGFRAENVVLLHDKATENKHRPSQRNIEQQLNLVINNAEADDLLVVAFSGHGVSVSGKSYLCPSDARLGDPTTLISLDGVYEQLRGCAARFKWVLVDACRNDPTLGGQRSLTATEGTKQLARSLQELKLPEGVVLLNSCAPGEISWEEQAFGHGVYMHYILEAMDGAADTDGDGAVSLYELQRHASGRTRSYVTGKFNSTQRPFYRSEGEAAVLEYALIRVTRKTALPAKPPTLQPAKSQTAEVPASLLDGGDPIVEAWANARAVLDPEWRFVLLRSVAAYQVKILDLETAKEALAEAASAARTTADARTRSDRLKVIAVDQAKLPDLDSAKTTMAEAAAAARVIGDALQRCTQLRLLAEEQAKLPDVAGAKNTLAESAATVRTLENGTYRILLLRDVAEVFHKIGESSQAKQILDEALRIARNEGRGQVLLVAEAQARIGDTVSAVQTFDEAKLAGKSPLDGYQLAYVAIAQARAGMETAARATYDEALRLGKIDHITPTFLGEVAEHQVRQGQLKAATETLRSIGDPNSDSAQHAYWKVAEGHANQGELDTALAIASQLTNQAYRNNSIGAVVFAMRERGDTAGALSTLAGMPDDARRQVHYSLIGQTQLKQDDTAAALLTARSMAMSSDRIRLLARIGVAQAEQDAAAAESLFNETLTGIASLKAVEVIPATATVAAALAEAGQLKRAYEIAYAQPTPEGKAWALIAIANALHEKKNLPKKETSP